MAISFHELTAVSFLRGLDATVALLEKASTHFVAEGTSLEEVVETSLHPDMKPFRFQIRSVAHHSLGAIQGLRDATFSPPPPAPPYSYAQLQAMMAETRQKVSEVTAQEMAALAGGEVLFVGGDRRARFTAENFILSFSLPNFYFHKATAYDILRQLGVPLEKRDYLGKVLAERAPPL